MKAQAARQEGDGDDLRMLAKALNIENRQQALDLVERFYGADQLLRKTQLILEGLLDATASLDATATGDAATSAG